ncbi:thymidylate synthase [Neobacillus soli]|uniref:thymidylate synthase n=1 Tax=Neobacillus soli TaxID=220688 RepID=UPI00082689D2|nr:thymidylate synthase [Neobacillus soli]
MLTVLGNNFTEVYYNLLKESLRSNISTTNSRNGEVRDFGPAYFEITNKDIFRIPLLDGRGYNPFFALTEYSWLISGSNKLEPLNYFIKNYNVFSDDGKTLYGAYGYRLKKLDGEDQIRKAIKVLKNDKTTRRVVLTMWRRKDLGYDSKDIPCNVSIMLKIRNDHLDMTVINRSNDIYLGVPYNVLVFYLLQCYIANQINCKIGHQRHFTDSLHLYSRHFEKVNSILEKNNPVLIDNLFKNKENFDISTFINLEHDKIIDHIYNDISEPYHRLFETYRQYKYGLIDSNSAIKTLPENLLGYSAYLWFKEKKDFHHNDLNLLNE